jgi:hypothetical protein
VAGLSRYDVCRVHCLCRCATDLRQGRDYEALHHSAQCQDLLSPPNTCHSGCYGCCINRCAATAGRNVVGGVWRAVSRRTGQQCRYWRRGAGGDAADGVLSQGLVGDRSSF